MPGDQPQWRISRPHYISHCWNGQNVESCTCTEPSLSAMSIFHYFEYPSGLGRVLIFLECVEGEGDYPRQRLAA